MARGCGETLRLQQNAWHDALQHGVDGGQQQQRPGDWLDQPCQRGQASGDNIGHRRDAVIGQAIPGGKAQDVELGRKDRQLAGQHGGALVINRHMHDDAGARRLGDQRQQHGIEPLRHAGEADTARML